VETLFGVVERLRAAGIAIVYVSHGWTSCIASAIGSP